MSKKKQHKKLVPELRFPEFKKDKEWNAEPMNKLYSFKVTNSFSRAKLNYENGSVKNIHYGDIHTKFSTLFDITKEEVPYINTDVSIDRIKSENYCKAGDLIFADASEDLDDVGKSIEIVNLNKEKLLAGLHTLLARQIKPKLEIGFAGYLFKSSGIRSQIKREAQGAKVLGISAGRLSDIEVFYPTKKEEQQKIANCLSSLDDLITAENKKLGILKDHKKGLLQQLFPAEGKTVPELRFSEFKNKRTWETDILENRGSFTGGGTPSKSNESYWLGEIPWISSSDIAEDSIHQLNITRFITEKAIKSSATKRVPKNSVLIVSRVGVGKLAISTEEICTSQDFTNFTPFKDDLTFLGYYLKSQSNKFLEFSQGMAIRGFTKNDISKLQLAFPDNIEEQQKIASCLSSIDKLIDAQTQRVDSLKAHKKGLMQQLFPNPTELEA